MSDHHWSNVIGNFCANCNLGFDDNIPKASKVEILDSAGTISSSSDIQILEAFLYIYGLSREDFAQIFPQNFDETVKYFTDTGGDEVALCHKCLSLFRDLYGMYIKFENLSKEESLLKRVIRFSRNQKISVKKEPECIEDHNENDDNLFNSWDSNEDNSDESNEDTNNLVQSLEDGINYDTTVEDERNRKLLKKLKKSESIGRRPRGRPRKVAKTEKLVIKISKRQYQQQPEVENTPNSIKYENESTFQPYIRLTRSKVHGSELKKRTFQKYGNDEDSSGSDDDDSLVKKKKPSIKQRMILKKYRDKPLMTTNSEDLICNVKQEGEFVDDDKEVSNSEDGIRRGSKKFAKIRPENGKRLVYVCNVCGKSITRIKLFKVHMNAHKKEANKLKRAIRKKVKCPHCDKLCKNEDSLKIHESNHHSGAPKICDKCGKTFMRMESLKLHQRFSHTEDKQFECKTCGMKYKWKGSLQSHELTHKNPRPHVCERCGMTFANKSNLNRHKTYHEDEEQDKELFRCQECGKILKNRKSLKKHINGTHREDMQRIFTCPTCGKTTKTKPNLRAHMKIHDPNRVMKRKSDVGRNLSRTESETVIQSLQSQHILPHPVADTYQVPTSVVYGISNSSYYI